MDRRPTMELTYGDVWEYHKGYFQKSFLREKGRRALGIHGLGNLEQTKPTTFQ